MKDPELALIFLEHELSEWKEELGEYFPSFLNGVLISRLLKAQDEIDFLRKRLHSLEILK